MPALHDDAKGIHSALTLRDAPGQFARPADGAMAARIEDNRVAVVARLVSQLVAFRRLPKGLGIGLGETGLWSLPWHCLLSPPLCISTRQASIDLSPRQG